MRIPEHLYTKEMKIEELIERLQEEQKIHPFTEVAISESEGAYHGTEAENIIFNGQRLIITP